MLLPGISPGLVRGGDTPQVDGEWATISKAETHLRAITCVDASAESAITLAHREFVTHGRLLIQHTLNIQQYHSYDDTATVPVRTKFHTFDFWKKCWDGCDGL